ncbi:MAG: hypothetical protein ABJD68_06180 [Nakamurella sp.]
MPDAGVTAALVTDSAATDPLDDTAAPVADAPDGSAELVARPPAVDEQAASTNPATTTCAAAL